MRGQAGRILVGLSTILNGLRRPRRSSAKQDYFTGLLPPEIRLLIYRYILSFDLPITLLRKSRSGQKMKKAGILGVNRLIYQESLPIFHELNTIVISREEFCHYPTGKRPQLTCKPDLVQYLKIRSLTASARCEARIGNPACPPAHGPCRNCWPSIVFLIDSLRLKPKLREVFIEYQGFHYRVHALVEDLVYFNPDMNKLRITCTGIGTYELTGSWLRGIRFQLCDQPLVEVWDRVITLPAPHAFSAFYLRHVQCWHRKRAFTAFVFNAMVLMMNHDAGFVPASIAES